MRQHILLVANIDLLFRGERNLPTLCIDRPEAYTWGWRSEIGHLVRMNEPRNDNREGSAIGLAGGGVAN